MQELYDMAKKENSPIAYHKYHYMIAGFYGLYLEPEADPYSFIQEN